MQDSTADSPRRASRARAFGAVYPVRLTAEQARRVAVLSAALDASASEVLRRGVDALYTDIARQARGSR